MAERARPILDGLSANRKLSSDALCLAILREVFERKSSDFRPPEVLPVSTLYTAVRYGVFREVFSSLLRGLRAFGK